MNRGIVVVGAGGHAKVCIELLRAMGEHVDYCVGGSDGPLSCVGVPVLHGDEHLSKLRGDHYRAFIAIGSNRVRARLATIATGLGYELVNAISPSAVISSTVSFGSGVAVMAGAVINAEAFVDSLAIVNTGATVDHDCRIGHAAHIAPQCGLAGCVSVGAQSFLGIGARVIPDKVIGSHVIVGAGGVVISDIGDGLTVVGVPARPINVKR
ncbi:acetyltransferase [Caballeronia sp. SBC2]|uniref:acetyltransferase n=1 Tax=Caballeronia sp. SBC2 TaxID=2705547 RepID=UPI0013E1C2F1|nr:acetyltransferase [Caballeronia sp. SBC2]QIE24849.1 Putative acetyltransferase EpsM [Caballeronia sp. SBC2]